MTGELSQELILERLIDLDEKVMDLSVPLSYTDELYALRNNITLVKNKILEPAKTAPISASTSTFG